jgi:hypothetical protein
MPIADDHDPGHEVAEFPEQQRTETPQLEVLRAAGYVDDFEVAHGELVLRGTGPVDLASVHIDQQYRFEGASDPDYESLVLALHAPATGARGVLITAYGPSASASEAEILSHLTVAPDCPDSLGRAVT